MKDTTVNRLRKRAMDLLLEVTANAWIVVPPDSDEITRLNEYRRYIEKASRKQLYIIIDRIEKKIEEIRSKYSISAPSSYLVEMLAEMKKAPPGHFSLVPLYLWRKLFKGGLYPWPGLEGLPLHARIGLDTSGLAYSNERKPEIYLLEAILFEDMAALYNAAKREWVGQSPSTGKPKIKFCQALFRSSTIAAFHFVEAYVNGLAVDYVNEHEDALDISVKSTLLDWDFNRNRPRYLSLKDKILQYQRFLLGVDHAPVQESNCPAMEIILGYARVVRDAIAHPSPASDLLTMETKKESIIINLSFDQTHEVIDAAIKLVKRVETEIRGNLDRLFWLSELGPDGFFPDETFA